MENVAVCAAGILRRICGVELRNPNSSTSYHNHTYPTRILSMIEALDIVFAPSLRNSRPTQFAHRQHPCPAQP